jgi:hypothetical protein
LRLLLVEAGSNKALLFRVAAAYKARITFRHPDPNHPRTWDELLDTPMMQRGDKSVTFRNAIRSWAEQLGGTHEDWLIDEMLVATQREVWIRRPSG